MSAAGSPEVVTIGGCRGNCCYQAGWLLRGVPRRQGAGAQPTRPSITMGTAQRSPESVWTLLPLHRVAFPCRNLEQEISFDFGPSGEFAYLYRQCYELTTNE